MHKNKLDIKTFRLIYELGREQPWICKKNEALYELIEKCSTRDEQHLICDLINRFTYLYHLDFEKGLNKIVDIIVNRWNLPKDNTRIIAATFDYEADSAQYLIYSLKPLFVGAGWNKPTLRTVVPKSLKGEIKEDINIILVDEFIGTGSSMLGRVKHIKDELESNRKLKKYEIRVCVLASMEEGTNLLEDNGITVFSCHVLKKGISDYYENNDLAQAKDNMINLEGLLMKQVDSKELPSFGYRKAEALYGRELGNTPNSVFPIFWWPCYLDGKTRATLLTRGF